LRKLYKIKGGLLVAQFSILVILTFVVICCIYIIKLVTRRKSTLTELSLAYQAFCIAMAIPEVAPANSENVMINTFNMN